MENIPQTKTTNIINNISFKSSPVTTIMGILFTLIGIALFILPIFFVEKSTVPIGYIVGIFTVGICLILIPDDLKGALSKLITRKSETL